ncbi:NAD(P)-binding domain-containing protein [Helicobacter pylori]|uniref:NAD(P)-binding domain-containing protein n=1 Tax=Helicobacter pylori TaxID=210 RepID=UPI000BE84333|nr:NAD(P)/FAD-dependent oxidoreductase [Helicobacter pylori]PDX37477.1 pyridine nucleotide-disulfide oxidoreductase [Helicobacter pylori]
MSQEILDVLIVGAGPGGIATAVECEIAGVKKVLLCEKTESHSGMLEKFYKAGKRIDKDYKKQVVELKGHIPFKDSFKEETLENFTNLLKEHRITPSYKTDIESVKKEGEYFKITTTSNTTYHAKFVVVAIGKMGQPNRPTYKIPVALSKQVVFSINDCKENEKTLVIGGGNSAVEYAIALCKTTPTTLNYRKKEFSRINEDNAKNLQEVLDNNTLKSKLGVDIESLEEDPNLFIVGDILFKSGASIATALNHGYDVAQEIAKRLCS